MMSHIEDQINQLIQSQQLPESYRLLLDQHLYPLSQQIARQHQNHGKPLVVAVNGGQGSGKSTACLFLKSLLASCQNKQVVVLSQDDFYLSRAVRQRLASDVHPLLKTRGVPGTHDVQLAVQTIEHLLKGETVKLPQFDKAEDDCIDRERWPMQKEAVDIILLEGWCVGALPQDDELLALALNDLEKNEDRDGAWRRHVNHCLSESYQQWFAMIDYLIMLKVPSIDSVHQWRGLQEEKLKESIQSKAATQTLSAEKITRFVQHFERLTLHQLQEMPDRADVVFHLNEQHGVKFVEGLSGSSHEQSE